MLCGFLEIIEFHLREYYWEIDLEECSHWTVGVCTDSWLRKRLQLVESEGVSLPMCAIITVSSPHAQ